jgi:phosphoribosylanthranilate isomerase
MVEKAQLNKKGAEGAKSPIPNPRSSLTRIKICGITREEDALVVARAGADAVGLVFYERSPRHVSITRALALVNVLPPFVTTVGLFVDADADFVRQVLATVPLDLLQFHGDESPEYCVQFGRPYLKAIRVKAGVDLIQCAARYQAAKALLLDAHVEGIPGGTGATFDWTLIPQQLALPVILSGGLDARNVTDGVSKVRPYAVDVSSGVEVAKGIKDAAKVAAFINEVKRVDSVRNCSEQA